MKLLAGIYTSLVAVTALIPTMYANVIPPTRGKRSTFISRSPFFRQPSFFKLPKREDNSDVQYLNFALTLEYLEAALYEHGLQKYSEGDFKSAGYPDWARSRLGQIGGHERTHVQFLQSAISAAGSDYVKPCEYSFNDFDPTSFITVSEALESVGTAAYTGMNQFMSNKAYLTALSSVLATEARHTSWLYAVLLKGNPWNTAFETGLTPNQAFTLASAFTVPGTCPQTNTALLPTGLHAYPFLSLPSRVAVGQDAELTFDHPTLDSNERLYAAFLFGASTIFTPLDQTSGGKYVVQIPRDLKAQGGVFMFVVKGGESFGDIRMDDGGLVAGPSLLMFPFDAQGNPPSMAF